MWQRAFLQSDNYVTEHYGMEVGCNNIDLLDLPGCDVCTSYFHALTFGYIIIRLHKRTLPHTEKLKKMYYY